MTEQSFATQSEVTSKAVLAVFAVLVTTLLIGAQWLAEMPPAPRSVGSGFLGATAMKDLRFILEDGVPHPTGTERNAAVRARLVSLLRGLGYVPEQRHDYICSETGICADLENVVVSIPGIEQENGILLDAHYDSVAAAPGAADNGSGVAIAVEIARAFKTAQRPRHPVFVLFDDGEEQQLLGARAFVRHDPSAQTVKWVVNIDARGVTGPSMMFETSNENADIIQFYSRNTKRPVANSLMSDLYRQLPSDTNFTVFRSRGWKGFNLAFLGKTQFYHRTADAVDNLDPHSVQHQGEEALELVKALAESPPTSTSNDDAVYFDLLTHLFWWPSQGSAYGTVIAAGLLVCGIVRQRGRLAFGSVVRTTLMAFLILVLAAVIGFLVLRLALPGILSPMLFLAHPAPFVVTFFAIGIAVALALHRIAQTKTSLTNYSVGLSVFWILLAAATSLVFLGGSYLFVLPSIAIAAATLWINARSPIVRGLGLLPATLLTGALWMPLLRLLYDAVGLITFPFMAVFAANLLLLFLPLLQGARRWFYRGSLAALAVAAITAAAGMGLPHYTKNSPMPLNLSYVQVASGDSYWLTACGPRNLWRIKSLIDAAGFHSVKPSDAHLAWIDRRLPWLEAAAPNLNLGVPEFQVLSKSVDSGMVTVVVHIQSAGGTDRSVLYVAPAAGLRSLAINGTPVPDDPASNGQWRHYETTLASDGAEVNATLIFESSGSEEIYIGDLRYGLPPEAEQLLKARPQEAMASQDGDTTLVLRRATL